MLGAGGGGVTGLLAGQGRAAMEAVSRLLERASVSGLRNGAGQGRCAVCREAGKAGYQRQGAKAGCRVPTAACVAFGSWKKGANCEGGVDVANWKHKRREGCRVLCSLAALQGGLEYMMITRDQTTTNHSTKRSPHPQLRRTLATRRRRRRHWGTYSQMLFTVHAHATQLHI